MLNYTLKPTIYFIFANFVSKLFFMRKYSKLSNLIFKLTPQEKRYFNLFSKSFNGKEKHYIVLFNLLKHNPLLDNEEIKSFLKQKDI